MRRWLIASLLAAVAGRCLASGGCAPADGLNFICGPVASEDLVRIPATPYMIASGLNVGRPARLFLIDTGSHHWATLYPGEADRSGERAQAGSDCLAPPDPHRMSLDGLALRIGTRRHHVLYAANHGDRMAIEMFDIDARGEIPTAAWIGCARLPEHTLPNAVAPLPAGGLLAISPYDPDDPQAWSRMARGERTGRLLEWHPGRGFRDVPNGRTSGGNGLETSADGRIVYASAWSARRIVILSLQDHIRREIALDFMPDNIHRQPDGSLLVAGQRTSVEAIARCTGAACPQPWVVARIDPQRGAVQRLLERSGSALVNYAAGAQEVDGTLYVSVRGRDRIVYFPLARAAR